MGIMRRELLFGLLLAAFLTTPCLAAVTVEESTDAEFLLNSGYSEITAEDVFMLKNRANGKPVEPLYEKSQNKFIKFCRSVYAYIDPAQDTPDRLHHDVDPSPVWSDL